MAMEFYCGPVGEVYKLMRYLSLLSADIGADYCSCSDFLDFRSTACEKYHKKGLKRYIEANLCNNFFFPYCRTQKMLKRNKKLKKIKCASKLKNKIFHQ